MTDLDNRTPLASFSNLLPDLRLGLLMVVAALLLKAGGSGIHHAVYGSDGSDPSSLQGFSLFAAFALGSLFVVGAAFWVDRRPPHGLMAAGALSLALGRVLLNVSDDFALYIAGMFVAGFGGAFVGSLMFYAVIVKGYIRWRGTLIGVLALVFAVRWEDWAIFFGWGGWASSNQGVSMAIWWLQVCLVLAAGALLFLLLPRCFSGTYCPGPSLWDTLSVPGVRTRILWAAVVYLVGAILLAADTTHLRWVALANGSDFGEKDFGFHALAIASGAGALVWGVAADFLPVRRVLIVLAALSLPAIGWIWLFQDLGGGALLLSFVRGGLISLSWILMADILPRRHFAKLALAITCVGFVGSVLGPLYWGWALDLWRADVFFWVILAEAGVLAAVIVCRPKSSVTPAEGIHPKP